MRTIRLLTWLVHRHTLPIPMSDSTPIPGSTTICRWKDNRKAVFLLMFDDNAPTMISNVIPELLRRGMPGTFYINPANAPFQEDREFWENPLPGIELANHTYSHVGATSEEQLEEEIQRCQEVLHRINPDRKIPRLISFGRPGGVPWTITEEEQNRVFARHHLVVRPAYKGYPWQFQNNEQILALVDSALACGGMEYIAYHGVGGDWHPVPTSWFVDLLDKLEAHLAEIWITDPISWHQYVTERDSASVLVKSAEQHKIRLELSSSADPAFYDYPLTLETRVPEDWNACLILQQESEAKSVEVSGGVVRLEAIPGRGEILLQKLN